MACAPGFVGSTSSAWSCASRSDAFVDPATGLKGVQKPPTGTMPSCVEYRVKSNFELAVSDDFASKLLVKSTSGQKLGSR